MLPQLERQYLSARLAGARQLLADSPQDDDPISYHQYSQLVNELELKIQMMPQKIALAPAGLALFFGGRPVMGSHGIDAKFGSKALEIFQKLVSQRFAADALGGPLPSKGPLPMNDRSQLIMTDVVRGSFGFVLQASQEMAESEAGLTLKNAVDKVADTLSRVSAQDESLFDNAAEEIDARQQSTLTDFFTLLENEDATMRIVEGERDFELKADAVQRARTRVENMTISDREQEVGGYIVGWSDHRGTFDLQLHEGGEVMTGQVMTAELERLVQEGVTTLHQHVRARVKVREISVRQRLPKKAYTLLSLVVQEAPGNWQKVRQGRLA
jgi:hypothetical protein